MKKIITCELLRDALPTPYATKYEFREDSTYYFDVPRIDLRKWNDARIRITIKEEE